MSILYEERLDGALPDVDRTSVLMALREHVPGLEILHTDEEIIPYECDGLSAYRTRPLLVVLPKQMEQVTAILAVCHRLRVPVVTRGAGTGLSGGALPLSVVPGATERHSVSEAVRRMKYLTKWIGKYQRFPEAQACPEAVGMPGLELCDIVPSFYCCVWGWPGAL